MCDLAVDLAPAQASDLGADGCFAEEIEALRPLADDGLLVIDGHRLRMTEKGRPFVRLVAAAFDAYLPRGQARHSAAV